MAVVVGLAAWQLTGSGSGTPSSAPTGETTTTRPTTTGAHTPPKQRPKKHVAGALPTHAVLVASRGPCWLEVRQGGQAGTLIYENTLQQGQKLPVALTSGPVWMRIGSPSSLDIRLGSKLVHGLPNQPVNVLLNRRGASQA